MMPLITSHDSDDVDHNYANYNQDELESLPDFVDWRSQGYVNPIEDQGNCGSCWVFSAICSVEGIHAMKTGKLLSLSKQEVLDCEKRRSEGCKGGYLTDAFKYIVENGVTSEDIYPYTGQDGQCNAINKPTAARIDGYSYTDPNNEQALQARVAKQVVSVMIKSNSTEFKLYNSGIFTGACGPKYDHSLNIVGYGIEDGHDYWIVRNSWGTNWGEDGYMRIIRNTQNPEGHCGIAEYPYYPFLYNTSDEVESESSF